MQIRKEWSTLLIIMQIKTKACLPFRPDVNRHVARSPLRRAGVSRRAGHPPLRGRVYPQQVSRWLGTPGSLGAHHNFLRAWRRRFPWLLPATSPSFHVHARAVCPRGAPSGPTAPYQQVCQGSHTGRQGRGLVTQAFLSFRTGDTSVVVTGLLAGLAVLLRSRQCRALCLPPEQLWSPVAEGGHCHDPRQTLATGALLSGKSLVKQCL